MDTATLAALGPYGEPGARDLVLDRLLRAPRAAVWRCWTEPALLKQWFAPAPWTTPEVSLDLRPGGASRFVMRSPEGQDFPSAGVYLEVVPERRLVFTDATPKAGPRPRSPSSPA
jgi:uncharacterized protein YndB with AHSA1/START domain